MQEFEGKVRKSWRAALAGIFGLTLCATAVSLIFWPRVDVSDSLAVSDGAIIDAETDGSKYFARSDNKLFSTDNVVNSIHPDKYAGRNSYHPQREGLRSSVTWPTVGAAIESDTMHDSISWPKTVHARAGPPSLPASLPTGRENAVNWPTLPSSSGLYFNDKIGWPSSEVAQSSKSARLAKTKLAGTQQLFGGHIKWPSDHDRVEAIEREVAKTLRESQKAIGDERKRGVLLAQRQQDTQLSSRTSDVQGYKLAPRVSELSSKLQAVLGAMTKLSEKLTDDDDVCGLACGNATNCVSACKVARARLHGWMSPEPTDDEATCTHSCGPHAPHCVRRCVKERARLHGWADVTPTDDEQICTYDCGPFAPHCVHSCVKERARMHGWVGIIPTADEAACTKACGPYAPHCVHLCVADRALTSTTPKAVTADAAGAAAEVSPCLQACGDSHACVRACERARALAKPTPDELVCAQACGDSHACNVACVRQRTPAAAAPPPSTQVAPVADDDTSICAKACGKSQACSQACLRERMSTHAPAPSQDEAVCEQACGDSHACFKACARERALMHPSSDEAVCGQACGDSHACVAACIKQRAPPPATSPAAAVAKAAPNFPPLSDDDDEVCAQACGDSPTCVSACSRERRRLHAPPPPAGDEAVCSRACGDSHTCYKACIRERAINAPSSDEAVCSHACGDSHTCVAACMRQRAEPKATASSIASSPAASAVQDEGWCANACGDSRLCVETCQRERTQGSGQNSSPSGGASFGDADVLKASANSTSDIGAWCADACADSHVCTVTCIQQRGGSPDVASTVVAPPAAAAQDDTTAWCDKACGDSELCFTTCKERKITSAPLGVEDAAQVPTGGVATPAEVEAWCADACGDSHMCVGTCERHHASAPAATTVDAQPPAWCTSACGDSALCLSTCQQEHGTSASSQAAQGPTSTAEAPADDDTTWCANACGDSHLCMVTCAGIRAAARSSASGEVVATSPPPPAPVAAPADDEAAWCARACGDSLVCVGTCIRQRAGPAAQASPEVAEEAAVMFTLQLPLSLEDLAAHEGNYTAAVASAAGCSAGAVEVLSVQEAQQTPAQRRLLQAVVEVETEIHAVDRADAGAIAARIAGAAGLSALSAAFGDEGLPPAISFAKAPASCSRGGEGATELGQWLCEPVVTAEEGESGEAPEAAAPNATASTTDEEPPTVAAVEAQPLWSTSAPGAVCGQGPATGSGGDSDVPPQICPVLARPEWGKMKDFPVDASPQVANGCVSYVCRSERKVGEEFIDEKILDGADDVIRDVPSTVHSVEGVAGRVQTSVRGWVGHAGEWLQKHAARRAPGAAGGAAARTLGGGQQLAGAPPLDPNGVPAGSTYESAVRACMYPSMTCAEQLASARSLCRNDGYWRRRVEGFNCTGGFVPPRAAAGTAHRWRLVTHFVISLLLVSFFAVIVWIVVSRPPAAFTHALGGGGGGGGSSGAAGGEEMDRPAVVRVTL